MDYAISGFWISKHIKQNKGIQQTKPRQQKTMNIINLFPSSVYQLFSNSTIKNIKQLQTDTSQPKTCLYIGPFYISIFHVGCIFDPGGCAQLMQMDDKCKFLEVNYQCPSECTVNSSKGTAFLCTHPTHCYENIVVKLQQYSATSIYRATKRSLLSSAEITNKMQHVKTVNQNTQWEEANT